MYPFLFIQLEKLDISCLILGLLSCDHIAGHFIYNCVSFTSVFLILVHNTDLSMCNWPIHANVSRTIWPMWNNFQMPKALESSVKTLSQTLAEFSVLQKHQRGLIIDRISSEQGYELWTTVRKRSLHSESRKKTKNIKYNHGHSPKNKTTSF